MSKYTTSYKEYMRGYTKRYDKRTEATIVLPTIKALMSEFERIAIGRFKWNGVDGNGIALSRKIEEYLFYFKRCAIVDTNEVGLAVVKVLPIGINIYGEPAGYDIVVPNGIRLTPKTPRTDGSEGQIGNDNAIILNDSCLIGRGCIDGMWHWITQIADAQISMNQQLINQRSPLMAFVKTKGSEQVARVQTIDVINGLNALMVEEGMEDTLRPLNLDSQFNVQEINAIQHEYRSRALSAMGVDSNQAFGKKERLIVDEAESNDEALAMVLSDCLKARSEPLIGNPIAEQYGISVELARPVRISTYKDNITEYIPVAVPSTFNGGAMMGEDIEKQIGDNDE